MSIYEENGFKGRVDYLKSLAEEYGVDVDTVFALATVLGRSEDFDGLVVTLEDYANEQERLFEGSKGFNSLLSILCISMMVVL